MFRCEKKLQKGYRFYEEIWFVKNIKVLKKLPGQSIYCLRNTSLMIKKVVKSNNRINLRRGVFKHKFTCTQCGSQ